MLVQEFDDAPGSGIWRATGLGRPMECVTVIADSGNEAATIPVDCDMLRSPVNGSGFGNLLAPKVRAEKKA